MIRARKAARGFTLVEALAAIAVMAICVPVLLQGFGLAGAIAQRVRHEAEATAVAQSCLDEILATKNYDGVAGEMVMNNTTYTFTCTQDQYENEVDLQQEIVTVTWLSRGKEESVTLTALIFIPETSVQSTTPGGGGLGGIAP